MDSIVDPQELDGWFPFQVVWNAPQQPIVDWCYLGEQRFTTPFATETIDECLRRPFNILFRYQTPIDCLEKVRTVTPGLVPNGFIFHLSRSGSTLVSQMLATTKRNLVISEAHVVDTAVRSYRFSSSTSETQRIEWLRQIIEVIGRPRTEEKNFIIKFDAWNAIDLPIIRRAFPSVPWIFVYRDPIEVMVSQFRRRGAHLVPGALDAELFGFDMQTVAALEPEEFAARVLASICQAALAHHSDGGLLINYNQLPEIVETELLDYFSLELTETELGDLRQAASRDAKNPRKTFEHDTERKRQQATEAIWAAADKWLYPVYEELEQVRAKQQRTVRTSEFKL